MKVKDCMTKDVVTVKRSTNLTELIEIFRKYNFHTLPVVEDGNKIVGIVTFEDILKVFQPYSQQMVKMLETIPFVEKMEEEDILLADISSGMGVLVVVDDFMNTRFVTIKRQAPIKEARSQMRLHNIEMLPVVENGTLVGIVTLFDIIISVFKQKGVIK
ncbi:MAG: CBS domain-containing protein [Candidatus Omnitrophota bacterium]|nr:MAG: CBS domain-containing protein [Candidatus Omnitrophota bacterium]